MVIDPRIIGLRLAEFHIPLAFRGITLTDIKPRTEAQRSAIGKAIAFVNDFADYYVTDRRPVARYPDDRSTVGKGLFFIGKPGGGKTMIAAATAQEIYFQHRLPACFIYGSQFLQNRVEQFGLEKKTDDDSNARWWEIQNDIVAAREVPLLVLDDFGKEHRTASGYAEGELDRLLRERHAAGRPTIMTSNGTPEDWAKVYHESMSSFIKRAFTTIVVNP